MKKFLLFSIAALCAAAMLAPAALYAEIDTDSETAGMVADQKIMELSNKYVAFASSFLPEEATRMGTLGYHNALNQRDTQSQISLRKSIIAFKDSLDRVDADVLSSQERVDYAILNSLINKKLFEIDIIQSATKDPLWYLQSVDSIYDILIKKFVSDPDRVRDGLKRLQALPDILKSAQQNLNNPSDIRLKLAAQKATDLYNSFDNITYMLNKISEDEYTKNQITKASADAKQAVKEYADFLNNMLMAKDYADFRLGKDNYENLLKNVYMQDMSVKKIGKTLEKEVEQSRKALLAALSPVVEATFSKEDKLERTNKKGIIEIAPTDYYQAQASFKRPDTKDILDTYVKDFQASVKFFKAAKIFPEGASEVYISSSPLFLQNPTDPVVYIAPFPLLMKQKGDILVALPKTDDAAKNFTYTDIKISAAENINPGKDLMFAVMPEEGEVMAKVSADPFFVNGWVKYSLNLALKSGYFDTDEEKAAVAWYNYQKAIFAEADLKMQTKQFTYTQAIDYLIDSGINAKEAEANANYLAVHPLDGVAYIIGSKEFERLENKYKKDLGKKFDMAEYHKNVLKAGKIPLPLLDKAIENNYKHKDTIDAFNMAYF